MTTAIHPPEQRQAQRQAAAHQPWWLFAAELTVLAAASVLALELFLGACGVGNQEFVQPDPELGCVHIPGKAVTWRLEGYSTGKLNSLGLRDTEHSIAKDPGITRIAFLGDSQTEGLQVPLGSTYCRILDAKLNQSAPGKFEVINFACSSYSTAQQLLYFRKEVAAFQPDVTVLFFCPGNAPRNVRDLSRRVEEPRPYFYLDGKGELKLDTTVLQEQKDKLASNSIMDFLRKNSRIYGVFAQTDLALEINERLYHKIRRLASKAAAVFGGKKEPIAGAPQYPQQDYWPVTRALIRALSKECRSHGSRFVVAVFPNMLSDPKLARQLDDLLEDSKEAGYGLVDLTPAFKAHPDPNSLFLKVHFSTEGHKLVAGQLFQYLSTTLRAGS